VLIKPAIKLDPGEWIRVGLESPVQVRRLALPMFNDGRIFILTHQVWYPLYVFENEQIQIADWSEIPRSEGE
jgi:hypothetical protein